LAPAPAKSIVFPNTTYRATHACHLSCAGGFKLAYKLMTGQLADLSDILYQITEPVWNTHSQRVKDVKTPQAAYFFAAWLAEQMVFSSFPVSSCRRNL
jgi:hypothetical protein